jgi:hypothetical protein
VTCRTCLTLNPPGAPACVRCNTPLAPDAPDPTTGSKQLGPGLAGSGRAAPGSSRAAAATVQPPGYGPPAEPATAADAPAATPADAPAEIAAPDLRRAGRRIAVAGLALVAVVLTAGGGALWLARPSYVDTTAVAGTLGTELTARLGGPVTVACPDAVRSRAGEIFACTARDTAGTTRRVTVTILDDAGRYRWELAR